MGQEWKEGSWGRPREGDVYKEVGFRREGWEGRSRWGGRGRIRQSHECPCIHPCSMFRLFILGGALCNSRQWLSTSREVPCGVPRALSLILSDLSLDENSGGILIKGIEVTNLGGRVNTRGDRMRTRSDPDRLECWVKNNKIQFNRPKRKVWHLRAKNKWQKHRVGEIALAGNHVKNIWGF